MSIENILMLKVNGEISGKPEVIELLSTHVTDFDIASTCSSINYAAQSYEF